MKKSTRIISLLIACLMMLSAVFMLASCEDKDDTNPSSSSDGSQSSSSSSSASSSSNSKEKFTVRIIDGMTGDILESVRVTAGRSAMITGDYSDYHYGYVLNVSKLNTELAAKVTENKDITLEYNEAEVFTIALQDKSGNAYTSYSYEFKERLSKEEIQNKKKNGGDDVYFVDDENDFSKTKNDFNITSINGVVKIYAGQSISDIPSAPSEVGMSFSTWVIVEDGGKLGDVFTGSNVDKNYTLRANYSKDAGAILFLNEKIQTQVGGNRDTALTVFDKITLATRNGHEYNTTSANGISNDGNEYLRYEGETEQSTNAIGTFRFAHGFGTFNYYQGEPGDMTPAYANPTTNKWTQQSSNIYSNETTKRAGLNVQIDQNTYMAFDGTYLYVYIVVRDDTVNNFKAADKQTIKELIASGNEPGGLYRYGDNVEIRYYLGDPTELKGYGTGKYDYTSDPTRDNTMRCLVLDREGEFLLTSPEPTGDGKILQKDYVSLIDLDKDNPNRTTKKLLNSEGEENGYVIGLLFDINGYNTAKGYDWSANKNIFKMAFAVQINDRFEALKKNDTSGNIVDADKYDECTNPDNGLVACGVQTTQKEYSIITMIKLTESQYKESQNKE
ncbi:MAG: hypothetical protein SOZ62_06750 [Eubacteriales bacterium]|nr:hypothetical protein [Eubacteriales bacterium]